MHNKISLFTLSCFGLLITLVSFASMAESSITTIGNITRIDAGGKIMEVEKGFIYEVRDTRKKIGQLYDPNFIKNNYTSINTTLYRVIPNYGNLAVQRKFTEDFESAKTIRALVGPDVNWTSMTIQGEASPNVEQYVALRSQILSGKSDFLDNRLDISSAQKRGGLKSLKAHTKATGSQLAVNKASLDTELVAFKKGDNFWFSGWFYLEKGKPTSIIDLESTYMVEAPGIRLMFDDELRPMVELKFANKPTFKMPKGQNYTIPSKKWFHVRMHIRLMDSSAGQVRLWIDDKKLIDQSGRTLTLFDAVYNSLQVGITAAPVSSETVLYFDDIRISDSGL